MINRTPHTKSASVTMFKGDWYLCLSWGPGFTLASKKAFSCPYDEAWGHTRFQNSPKWNVAANVNTYKKKNGADKAVCNAKLFIRMFHHSFSFWLSVYRCLQLIWLFHRCGLWREESIPISQCRQVLCEEQKRGNPVDSGHAPVI